MRPLIVRLISAATLLASAWVANAAPPELRFMLPKSGPVRVAFVISADATLIDTAGPMQVFDQIQAPGAPFMSFTVSQSRQPIRAGSLTIVPDYTFADAPRPDIVVVGAQTGNSPPYLDYLRQMAAHGSLMLSVCTGASKFAQAGLLDGLEATTHHDYVASLQKLFPKVRFLPDRAWIHSAPRIYTGGGETHGIELALHIVELYYDHNVALKTARYMDYQGPDWQS